jgi:hypothetical protein
MLMRRSGLVFGGSSAIRWSIGFAVVTACNVYDSSLLTGGSEGNGGSSLGGDTSGGDGGSSGGDTGGTSSGTGGDQGGGTTGGKGGDTGDTGGTGTGGSSKGGSSGDSTGGKATGGSATGGKGGGTTGGAGGTDPTGGKGGSSGGGAGSGGSSGGGNGGSGSGGNGGSSGMCGKCGCGMPETDGDSDGVLDCNDICMGQSDADCVVLKNGLVHRYSFSGTGTSVMDTKGTAHGMVMGTGAALSGSGTVVLAGGVAPANDPNKQYVALPGNLLMGLTNVTIELWLNWPNTTAPAVASDWQRIFDFGTAATNTTGSYVFLTPRRQTNSTSRVAVATLGSGSETMAGGAVANGPTITAATHHFVVVLDDTSDTVSIYVDGTLGQTVAWTGTLASITNTNSYLGRSNFPADPYLAGTFDEFRMYNIALTQAQLRTSRAIGPDATFF